MSLINLLQSANVYTDKLINLINDNPIKYHIYNIEYFLISPNQDEHYQIQQYTDYRNRRIYTVNAYVYEFNENQLTKIVVDRKIISDEDKYIYNRLMNTIHIIFSQNLNENINGYYNNYSNEYYNIMRKNSFIEFESNDLYWTDDSDNSDNDIEV